MSFFTSVAPPVPMRSIRLLCCSFLLLCAAAAASAQPMPDRGERMIERRLDRLSDVLGLSDAQVARIRALFLERAADARRHLDDVSRTIEARCGVRGSRPPDEQRQCVRLVLTDLREEAPQDRMRREYDETAVRIRTMLTPAQADRFDVLVRAERARWERRMGRPGGDGPPPRFGPAGDASGVPLRGRRGTNGGGF